MRKVVTTALLLTTISSTAALAQGGTLGSPSWNDTWPGTAVGARAMLERAVRAVQTDKPKALTAFTQGAGEFHWGDLYVFCIDAKSGKIDAHPNQNLIGWDVRTLRDQSGKRFGEEMLRVARPGQFTELTYSWPRLGTKEPAAKSSSQKTAGSSGPGPLQYRQRTART